MSLPIEEEVNTFLREKCHDERKWPEVGFVVLREGGQQFEAVPLPFPDEEWEKGEREGDSIRCLARLANNAYSNPHWANMPNFFGAWFAGRGYSAPQENLAERIRRKRPVGAFPMLLLWKVRKQSALPIWLTEKGNHTSTLRIETDKCLKPVSAWERSTGA